MIKEDIEDTEDKEGVIYMIKEDKEDTEGVIKRIQRIKRGIHT